MPTPPVKLKSKPAPNPAPDSRKKQPRRRSLDKPQYKAVAYLTGRPDEELKAFLCSDGSRMPIRCCLRTKIWIGQPGVFTEDAIWTVYPGHRGLALAWRSADTEGKVPDFMPFTARSAGVYDGTLGLYVGRNIKNPFGEQYHFVNLVVPEGLEVTSLEILPQRTWLTGHARRVGTDWVLVGWEVVKREKPSKKEVRNG